jgi:methylenetetrahydrofolate reductase (NADPH)
MLLKNLNELCIGIEVITDRREIKENLSKLLDFIKDVSFIPGVCYVSFTDNAGGYSGFSPYPLTAQALDCNITPIRHLTTKGRNRSNLEEVIWTMHFSGVRDILALTGDAPVYARHVYDLDSVSLVQMLRDMNHGLRDTRGKGSELRKTDFDIGVAVNPFKFSEAELMPQYYKLWKKVQAGAQYLIPQLGYDARKIDELHKIMEAWSIEIPVFGNVFLLSRGTAKWFHKGNVPGVLVSDELLEMTQGKDDDYFVEFAAKQMAIEVGLGAKGIHLGGTYSVEKIVKIMEI